MAVDVNLAAGRSRNEARDGTFATGRPRSAQQRSIICFKPQPVRDLPRCRHCPATSTVGGSKASTTGAAAMRNFPTRISTVLVLAACLLSCSSRESESGFAPREVIDLGASVTADLPERVWGRALLAEMGFTKPNSFEVIRWTFPMDGVEVSGSNAYYTLFNHGGPHLDAPNHFGFSGGIDSYPVEAFSGPAKAFDVSRYPIGRSIPVDVFRGNVEPGDIVLLSTGYAPPQNDRDLPQVTTLSDEAAEFLATLPVRAIGTDAFGMEDLNNVSVPSLHHVFLGRGIPLYESLFNVDRLIGKEGLYFVGVPLNIPDADGMIVRPVVFVH